VVFGQASATIMGRFARLQLPHGTGGPSQGPSRRGADTDPARCAELAVSLGMLVSDLLVVAGHPVPGEPPPPRRNARFMKEFGYRVAHCDHAQMAALVDFDEHDLRVAIGPVH
jgi:hypothetical protein